MKKPNMPDRAVIGVCLILIAAITTAMVAAAALTPHPTDPAFVASQVTYSAQLSGW